MKNSYLFFGLVLVAGLCFVNRAAAQNSLILKLNDGTDKGIPLNGLNKITFSAGSMVVAKADTGSESYLLSHIRKMTFGLFSGIEEITVDKATLCVYPNPASTYIKLNNVAVERDFNVVIFRIDGVQVLTQKLQSGSDVIHIGQLPKGIYLLKVQNKILKFTKQ